MAGCCGYDNDGRLDIFCVGRIDDPPAWQGPDKSVSLEPALPSERRWYSPTCRKAGPQECHKITTVWAWPWVTTTTMAGDIYVPTRWQHALSQQGTEPSRMLQKTSRGGRVERKRGFFDYDRWQVGHLPTRYVDWTFKPAALPRHRQRRAYCHRTTTTCDQHSYHNGDGTFTDVSVKAGSPTT